MSDLRTAAQQALEILERLQGGCTDSDDGTVEAITVWCPEIIDYLRAALAEPVQDIEDAIEAAYWHFDARKQGLNEWASAPQSERDAFKAEARKLVRGYFPTRQAQDTKREMLAVADAFIRGKRAALAEPEEGGNLPPPPLPGDFDHGIGADRFKVVRGAFWWHVLIGDSPTEHGKFRSRASAEKMAADLLREFRNGAFVQHEAALAEPVHKPLTEEEIDSIWDSEKAFADIYAIVRAIERAHGIV